MKKVELGDDFERDGLVTFEAKAGRKNRNGFIENLKKVCEGLGLKLNIVEDSGILESRYKITVRGTTVPLIQFMAWHDGQVSMTKAMYDND